MIVVPPGWAANIDRLGRGIGSAKSKVPEQPTEGYPLLLLRGGVGLGSVTVGTSAGTTADPATEPSTARPRG